MNDVTTHPQSRSGLDASTSHRVTQVLLACGVLGPLSFIVIFLIEGATRPGYSAWRNFVSSLSLGPGGWVQVVNFLVCGVLSLACAFGLRRSLQSGRGALWAPILVALFGVGLMLAGTFSTGPALGYPPGVGATPGTKTLHGNIHGFAGILAFAAVAAACFVLARRFAHDPRWKGWATYSVISGILVLAGFVASNVTSVLDMTGTLPGAPTGLVQRIAIVAGWGWIALVAARLMSEPRATDVAGSPGRPSLRGSTS